MKPFKRIAILFAMVTGIISCWLIPGLNKANDVRYTRVYEDTDHRSVVNDSIKTKQVKSVLVRSSNKVYKKESIQSDAKLADIKAEMFSRAIQFEPEVKIIEIDSVQEVNLSIDSVKDNM